MERSSGEAEGDDLGVGGGVVVAKNTVLATCDDLALEDNDGTNGHFAGGFRTPGLVDGGPEVVEAAV